MQIRKKIKRIFEPRLKLLPGTRLTSFLFIAASIALAFGILFAANIYYNIDTGEIVMEEIQRVTQVVRATAGLIVGGSATQNPTSGYVFEVVGQTRLATTSVSQGRQLRFYDSDETNYVGFRAPDLTQNSEYFWPTSTPSATGRYLTFDPANNQLLWQVPPTGGDIYAVGDVGSGEAFVSATGTGYGNILWFHPNATYTMALTAADAALTANATTVIPAVSGTNYLTLASSFPFTSGQVLYADASGLITGGGNLTFDATNRVLTIGSSGAAGELRIYDGSYYLGFKATSTMTQNTVYYWPPDYGQNLWVLTTDGAGHLSWQNVTGTGAVTGTGSPGQVTFWNTVSSITGEANFTWDATNDVLTISGTQGAVIANVFKGPSGATTTIASASGQNILLDPDSGKIVLGSGDWIETASGYQIGKTGTQILREMVPIMGFDLPARTGTTTSYVTISRTIETYPFPACAAGTNRIHKFVIRYADTFDAASSSDWRVWNVSTGATTTTFTVPGSPATSTTALADGVVYIATTTIPTPAGACTGWSVGAATDDWRVDLKLPSTYTNQLIQVYQIFLAAYDEIQ